MDIVALTSQNIDNEHICCALSSKTTLEGVSAKKQWLAHRIEEGLRFKKLDARGKVFIEYLPAENAWLPLIADGYLIINCFWVSGMYKGKGYGKALLDECEQDARANGFKGVAAIVGDKKRPFLTDKSFLLSKGYEISDSCPPFFELAVKRFDTNANLPRFKDCARLGLGEDVKGIDVYYTAQCPFSVPYAKTLIPVGHELDYPIRLNQIITRQEAQNHLCPITTYSLFVDGQFYTNEIYTADKLRKLIEKAAAI